MAKHIPTSPVSLPSGCKVRVRMYRQGLGDCFLLTFPGPIHVMIDCGVVLGADDQQEQMKKVVRDVAATTAGHIDVLVVTHEHWDHVSGFAQAKDELYSLLKIDEIWFAWTEDKSDTLARELRKKHDKSVAALQGFASRLANRSAKETDDLGLTHTAAQVGQLMSLFGAAGSATTRNALDFLIAHPSKPRIRYHLPNDVVTVPGLDGVRAFVLGPPHNERQIRSINPTKKKEGYGLSAESAVFLSGGAVTADEDRILDAFDERYRVRPDRAKKTAFYRDHYFGKESGHDWRGIESAWLGAGEELALALDSYTNNTSLALAFELEPGGQVMLFPGDAQVGNWESWQECSFPPDKAKGSPITTNDLLARTVLYKVGHHASHNATMRTHGLEMMNSPDLVAMIPVNHAQAEKKGWHDMPFSPLLDRLNEKTRGRVLRIDLGVPTKHSAHAPEALWKAFLERVVENPLYLDYHLPK